MALDRAAKAAIPSEVLRRRDFSDAEEYGKAAYRSAGERRHRSDCARRLYDRPAGQLLPPILKTALSTSHPSLIPSFCGEGFYGLRVHEAALAKGVKVTGATVHFVSEVVDGGAIIAQKAVEVEDGDTPETFQKRVMQNAEWILLPQAVSDFCAGRLRVDGAIVHKN